MPHRNLLLSTRGAEPADTTANLSPLRQVGLVEDTLQAFRQIYQAMPQELEPDGRAQSAPPPQPGWNIASTGQRAISAWRSGRRS